VTRQAILGDLGSAYAGLSMYDKSLVAYDQGLELARDLGDREAEGVALLGVGRGALALDQLERAVVPLTEAMLVADEIGSVDMKGEALIALGTVYRKQKMLEKAIQFYQNAIALLKIDGSARLQARALFALGEAHADNGESKQAEVSIRQARAIYDELGMPTEEFDEALTRLA
jgi:tetratricopeptide (TPR) repeat protein